MEEETERCAQVLAAHSLLGVQTAVGCAPRIAPHSPRQGSSFGLQGQAGACAHNTQSHCAAAAAAHDTCNAIASTTGR